MSNYVPGRADYCVYWFRKTHDALRNGQRAGLVGTNTIRQNYSRIGGLEYITSNGGTITEAVSSQVWSGDAVVHVSIVNWVKGVADGPKKLFKQVGDNRNSSWEILELPVIGPSLSFELDVSTALPIRANVLSTACYQGQTHGHEGFLLSVEEAKQLLSENKGFGDCLHPFLITDDLIGTIDCLPSRYVIDFFPRDLLAARAFGKLFARVQNLVLPHRKEAAKEEEDRNKDALADNLKARVNRHHANFLRHWWQLSYPRGDMLAAISLLPRYIACGRVTRRPIFEFLAPEIRPNDSLTVFPLEDDYSFGILQSGIHWIWFTGRCSTLKSDPRYTSNTVFDSFPWPQKPTTGAVAKVAKAAVDLRELRRKLRKAHNLSLRDLYRILELPGAHPLKDAQAKLDQAVREAYGMPKSANPLAFLLKLNAEVAAKEKAGETVLGPGLPPTIKDRAKFVTTDCLRMPSQSPTLPDHGRE